MANSDISGQITDGTGNPIGSAKVYLWREDLAGAGGVVASTTADSSGNFSFTAHPDGSGSSESWHVAAKDPNANVQLQSAYGVTASPPTSVNSQFNVSITGTSPSPVAPGDTLTVDASLSNSGTDSDTQTITLDVDNGVGQVDSSLEAAQGGASESTTLSWSVPSGQSKQDYQATVATDDDTASQTVTVADRVAIDDFESYSTGSVPSPYTATSNANSSTGVVATSANSGSQSLDIQGSPGSGFTTTVKHTFSPATANTIQVAYYETSSTGGGAIRWLDSNGEELCAVGSGNPQVGVISNNQNLSTLTSSPTPSYGAWRRFTITPDFANGTFDVLWEDIGGSTPNQSLTGLGFVGSPSDIAEIQFGEDRRGSTYQLVPKDTFLVDDSSSLIA